MGVFEVELGDKRVIEVEAADAAQASAHAQEWMLQNPLGGKQGMFEGVNNQFVEGMPIVGELAKKGVAAAMSAIAPLHAENNIAMTPDMTFGQRYDRIMDTLNQRNKNFAAENPKTALAANVAGSVAGTIPAAYTGPGAFALGLTAKTLPGMVAAGGLSGAGINAADAWLRGEDVTKAAGLGGALGATFPIVGNLAGRAYNAVAGKVAPQFANSATPQLARALKDDALTPPAINQKIAELGDNAMLADIGPNLRSQAEALVSVPGPGQRKAIDALAQRTENAGVRIENTMNNTLGPSRDIGGVVEQIIQQRKTQAAPHYNHAHAQSINVSPTIDKVLASPAGKKAVAKAEELLANEGYAFTKGSVRSLDYVKQALDDQVGTLVRSGADKEARIVGGLKDRLLAEMDMQVPSYKTARGIYESDSKVLEAISLGRDIFNKNITAGDITRLTAKMSKAEKDGLIQSARAEVDRVMGNARNDALAVRDLLRKDANREKLEMLLGKKTVSDIMRSVNSETAFANTAQGVVGNSKTAARQQAQKEFPGTVDGKSIPTGITAADALLYIPRKIAAVASGAVRNEKNAVRSSDAADALFATGSQRDKILGDIYKYLNATGANQKQKQEIRRVIQSGLLGASTLVPDRVSF